MPRAVSQTLLSRRNTPTPQAAPRRRRDWVGAPAATAHVVPVARAPFASPQVTRSRRIVCSMTLALRPMSPTRSRRTPCAMPHVACHALLPHRACSHRAASPSRHDPVEVRLSRCVPHRPHALATFAAAFCATQGGGRAARVKILAAGWVIVGRKKCGPFEILQKPSQISENYEEFFVDKEI